MSNDVKRTYLNGAGFPGSVDDAYRAYLADAAGVTSPAQIQDLEKVKLNSLTYSGNVNDMMVQHLRAEGYTGNLDEMLKAAWASGSGLFGATVTTQTLMEIITELGLTTGLKLALDAGDANSYSGSGQSWLDVSGNGYDYFRGATVSGETSDPTFNGVAGGRSSSEYFSFDGGDYFRYDAVPEAWMQALHKDGAVWSGFAVVYTPSLTANLRIFNTRSGSVTGVNFGQTVLGKANASSFSGATQTALTSSAALTASAWNAVGFSWTENGASDNRLITVNGAVEVSSGGYTTPDPTDAVVGAGIGADGAGTTPFATNTRLAMLAMWQGTALTSVQIASIYNRIKSRYGLYTGLYDSLFDSNVFLSNYTANTFDVTGRVVTQGGTPTVSASGVRLETGDYLTITPDSEMVYGTGDWATEIFYSPASTGGGELCVANLGEFTDTGAAGDGHLYTATYDVAGFGQLYTEIRDATGTVGALDTSSAGNLVAGADYYIAAARTGSTIYIFHYRKLSGGEWTKLGSTSFAAGAGTYGGIGSSGVFYLGRFSSSVTRYWDGTLKGIRMTKGNGRGLTGTDITVPTLPFPEAKQ
jgi:hypothetical protein